MNSVSDWRNLALRAVLLAMLALLAASIAIDLPAAAQTGPKVIDIAVADITDQGADITITLANPAPAPQQTVYYCIIPLPTGSCTGSSIQNDTTSSPHTSLVLTPRNLAADTRFEVRASLDSAMTNNVETASFTTFGPPKNLRFSATPADGALNLNWSVDLNGGSLRISKIDWKSGNQFYLLQRREHIFDMNVRSHTIPNLTNGTEYTVKLDVDTQYGNVVAEVTRAPAPGPTVSEVVLSNVEQTSATATTTVVNLNLGTEAVTAHLRYRVQGSTDDDDWSEPMTRTVSRSGNTANIAFNLTGLTGNTAYDVQALVTEGAETVDWLQSLEAPLMTAPSPPHAPVVVVTHADGSLDVLWTAPTNNGGADITKYVLQWKSGGEAYSSAREATADYDVNTDMISNTEITYANSQFSYTIPDLSNGTEYSVQVYAVNEGGNGTAAEETATPSTVPGSAPASILASECNSAIHLSWLAPTNTGGNPITSYTIQWKSGDEDFDDMAIPARHHVTKNSDLTYTLESLTNGTQYSIRILATNINGDASEEVTRDVTDEMTMMTTTITVTEPIWSEDVIGHPREGTCISGVRFGNILADSAPVIVDLKDTEDGTNVYMRPRPTNSAQWSDTQTKTANAGDTSVTFDATDLQPEKEYEVEVSLDSGFGTSSTARAFFTAGVAPTGGITGGGGGSIARILRIEPAIQNVVVSPGDTIRLDVNVYGRQGLLDNDLADRAPADGRPTFTWTSSGGGGFAEYSSNAAWRNSQADDRRVSFTTPATPGTVEIKTALLASNECQPARNDETSDDQIERCSATINVTVKRRTAVEPLRPAPVNPPGTIPESLSDSDGTAYAVFTPEDGGNFIGEGVSISAGAGAVASGEYIGISMAEAGDASNLGNVHQRYTLGGSTYAIKAVDSSADPVADYVLQEAATVCLPLPDELRGSIADIAIAAIGPDNGLTVLASSVKITLDGINVCGGISLLPASVAVGTLGAPSPPPVIEPEETEQALPETGGTAPIPAALILIMLLGMAAITATLATRKTLLRNR